MGLIVLLMIEIIIFALLYITSGYDLVSPANFSIFTYIIATIFAIIGSNIWGNKFSYTATLYMATGLIVMMMGQGLAELICKKKLVNKYVTYKNQKELVRIDINKRKVYILEILVVFLTAMYVLDILRVGRNLGTGGLAAISAVRYTSNAGTSAVIRQGIKVIMAASFVDSFILVHNLLVDWKRRDLVHVISLVCGCVCSLFTGVRTEILRMIFVIFVIAFLNLKEKKGWKRGVSSVIINKFLPIITAFALIFTSMKTIVKESSLPINGAFTTFEYIAYYIGSPIIVFGIKELNGFTIYKRTLFGEITFNAFWENIAQMGLIPSKYASIASTNVYISKSNLVTANVDTIFGGLMIDFGWLGMIIFVFFLYFFLSLFYYKKVKYVPILKNKFNCITYAFLFYMPGMAYYANVFGQFIATYFIITYLIIYLIYMFYFNLSFRRGFNIIIHKM